MPAPSIKASPGPTNFSDLPAEVRLQIYPYLFSSYETWTCPTSKDTSAHLWNSKWSSSAVHIRTIDGQRITKPSTVGAIAVLRDLDNVTYDGPAPQILATCKTVNREATSSLYASNTFQFHLPDDNNYVYHPRSSFPCRTFPCPKKLRAQCQNLFDYDADHWRRQSPQMLRNFHLACFMRRIGPTNAACLTTLHFYTKNTDIAGREIPLLTELATRHLPSLRAVDLDVQELRSGHSGTFQPMYHALLDLARRVPRLEHFMYSGKVEFEAYGVRVKKPSGRQLLTELGVAVERRGKGEKVESILDLNEEPYKEEYRMWGHFSTWSPLAHTEWVERTGKSGKVEGFKDYEIWDSDERRSKGAKIEDYSEEPGKEYYPIDTNNESNEAVKPTEHPYYGWNYDWAWATKDLGSRIFLEYFGGYLYGEPKKGCEH